MFVEIAKVGKQERPTVTSLDVAETFGKLHQHVLRDIRELGCSEEFRLSNFGQSSYENAQGHKQPMFIITRDGFTLLAMGYTGELAMKFKEAYIKQFNAMEAALQGKLIEREKGIAVRQALTKALQQSRARPCVFQLHELHLQGVVRERRGAASPGLWAWRKGQSSGRISAGRTCRCAVHGAPCERPC